MGVDPCGCGTVEMGSSSQVQAASRLRESQGRLRALGWSGRWRGPAAVRERERPAGATKAMWRRRRLGGQRRRGGRPVAAAAAALLSLDDRERSERTGSEQGREEQLDPIGGKG